MKDPRFLLAMAGYVIFALLAALTLDGQFRLAVLIFLAGLALKTWLVTLRRHDD
jgi:hypothetical protein